MPSRPPKHRPAWWKPYKEDARQSQRRQARRALATNSPAWLAMRRETLLQDGYCCRQCGRIVTGKGNAHIDHIDGDDSNNDPSNRQTLCRRCHSAKTARMDGGFGNARRAAEPERGERT